jgi:hypothetical protein
MNSRRFSRWNRMRSPPDCAGAYRFSNGQSAVRQPFCNRQSVADTRGLHRVKSRSHLFRAYVGFAELGWVEIPQRSTSRCDIIPSVA